MGNTKPPFSSPSRLSEDRFPGSGSSTAVGPGAGLDEVGFGELIEQHYGLPPREEYAFSLPTCAQSRYIACWLRRPQHAQSSRNPTFRLIGPRRSGIGAASDLPVAVPSRPRCWRGGELADWTTHGIVAERKRWISYRRSWTWTPPRSVYGEKKRATKRYSIHCFHPLLLFMPR